VNEPWWKRTSVYQIYPRSFADSNGDGIGDLRGVLGKLDYLQALGVETLWLSPFFQSPQADFGYDISDHYAIAPEYGTLADVRELLTQVHARGMKLVLDMVLNHTSAEHPWFLASRRDRADPRRDWYLWRDGARPGGKAPPNNWRSMLGGSGWHFDEATGQWYFASFLPFQPDLNYRNPEVKAAMLGVVRHWLREGVDGLRLDIFNALFKDEAFQDNPFSFRPVPSESNPHGFFQRHQHTIDHPETIAFARELRAVIDEFSNPPRFLVGEVFGRAEMLKRYCGEAADGLNLVFLFEALSVRFSAAAVRELVQGFERAFPEPFTPTWVFGNHDRPRFGFRHGGNRAKHKLLAALQLTARGVPFIYYGEELGMENHDLPLHEGLDPVAARFGFVPQRLASWLRGRGILMNRDECRSPMQWDEGPNAGFTGPGVKPWLPLGRNAATLNVRVEERDETSVLRCYQRLLGLRRAHPALQSGALSWLEGAPGEVVAYRRSLEGDQVDVYLNFSAKPQALELPGAGRQVLWSSARNTLEPAAPRRVLEGHEGALVFSSG
jgi:oligo-1,6-glucosidase/alpha-glucosidase